MNHVLWKHRIVGFRRSIDWFSDINHTSKSEFTKSLRVIVIHSSIHITCDLARLLYWILNVFRFRTKKTELDWFVVTGHLKMEGPLTRMSSQAPVNLLKSGIRLGTKSGTDRSDLLRASIFSWSWSGPVRNFHFFWSSGPVRRKNRN